MKKLIYVMTMENNKQAMPNINAVDNSLESFQRIVKGYIEAVYMENDVVALVNDEGAINGMEYNFTYKHHVIHGPVVFVSLNQERDDFDSLKFEQLQYLHDFFEVAV